MHSLTIYLDERAYRALVMRANRNGRDPEDLASTAVENEISKCREFDEVLPPGSPFRESQYATGRYETDRDQT